MIGAMPLIAAASGGHHESVGVLGDVVVVLAVCVIFGLIAQRLGQSVLVGYVLAGVLVGGPSSLGIVDDIQSFSFMGEVGIALLLFTVGLDLSFDKVRKFGRTALIAGTAQVTTTTVVAGGVALAFGTSWSAAFVIGFAVSLSSTAVVMSVLADRAETDSVHGLVATGILLAQDIIVVVVLILVPLLPGAEGGSSDGFARELAVALLKLIGLTVAIFVIERELLRRLFIAGAGTRARELLAVASITVSLGAIASCWALDLSPALGGFIAGIIMADAVYAPFVRADIAPIRMGLVAVFFAYVGMVADVDWLIRHLPLVLLTVVAVVGGKAILGWVSARIARVPATAAIMTAIALAQLGEFSFAVLASGETVGLLDADVFRLIISVSVVSLIMTPQLIQVTSSTLQKRSLADGNGVDLDATPDETALAPHAIVIGAGPAGRAVADALAAAQVPVTVIELNPRTETGAADDDLPLGTRVVFGDASHLDTLQSAGIGAAKIVVVTIPDPTATSTIIAQCRQLLPDLPIVARGRYNMYLDDLVSAGATTVIDEESVTGTSIANAALTQLALTGDVDRRHHDDA
jgi:CPA2 family monovalent cation:H+ antiporter-2